MPRRRSAAPSRRSQVAYLSRGKRPTRARRRFGRASGHEKSIAALVGEPIARADADFVRETTGFSIGGVPPVGHRTAPAVMIDEALVAFGEIWAAAGTPNAVFRLTPADLIELTGGRVAAVGRK